MQTLELQKVDIIKTEIIYKRIKMQKMLCKIQQKSQKYFILMQNTIQDVFKLRIKILKISFTKFNESCKDSLKL